MDEFRTHEHAMALAGLFQAVTLVQQVAREGRADAEPFESSISSLFRIDAEKCICCGKCAKECPVDCISGKTGKALMSYIGK